MKSDANCRRQLLALLGGSDVVAAPLEELSVEVALQLADAPTHAGL